MKSEFKASVDDPTWQSLKIDGTNCYEILKRQQNKGIGALCTNFLPKPLRRFMDQFEEKVGKKNPSNLDE